MRSNLIRPLRYRIDAQFGAILAALTGGALLLLYLLVQEMSVAIAFTNRERDGVTALKLLAEARTAAHRYRFADSQQESEAARGALLAVIDRLDRAERRRSVKHRLGLRLEPMRATLVRALPTGKMDEKTHQALSGWLVEATRTVGDASNLILDPDLDSYYTMDLVTLRLPEERERFSNLIAMLRQGESGLLPSNEAVRLQVALFREGLEAQSRSFEVARKNNPLANLSPALSALFSRRLAEERAFLKEVELLQGERDRTKIHAVALRSEASRRLTEELERRATSELEAILTARAERLSRRRFVTVLAAGLVVLLAVLFSIRLLSSISRTVAEVAGRLESLRGGEITRLERGIVALAAGARGVLLDPDPVPEAPLDSSRNDELGALACSVNRLADQTRVTLRALGTTQEALARAEAALLESEEAMRHQAFHDSLTLLPNRPLFVEQLSLALIRSTREKTLLSVLYLDLDNFKVVNDSMGHEVGDQLLSGVATLLSTCLGTEHLVARIGGDEFLILLDDLASEDEAFAMAERIAQTLERPIRCNDKEIFTGCSIGIAFCRNGEISAVEMIKDADIAMYRAKSEGKHRYVAFDDAMNEAARQRMDLEADLREALTSGVGLRLYFQPIYSLSNETLDEVEALVRWQHPEQGLILPDRFISLAEETGLILPLGEWVLREACAFARQWDVSVGVNLSLRQLQEDGIVERIAEVITTSGVDPKRIKLEVTESMMEDNPAEMTERLQRLRALGVRIALDDFGSGYSSMSHLRDMPIDTLKIDRSFVKRLGQSVEDEAIVLAMVQLAQALQLTIVCEGIETLPQQDCLQKLHCDFGQGFLYSPPRPAKEIVAMLSAARQQARRAA